MPKLQQIEADAKAWATKHVVAAVAIGIAIGFLIRSLF